MRRLSKASLALPVVIVAVGFLVPLFAGGRSERPADVAEAGIFRGRTATEWETMAARALEGGRHARAIAHLKSAERADPGAQYAERLRDARRALWAAREAGRLRARFLGSEIVDLAFGEDCRVASGHRTTVALPGESLWSIARAMVAAERAALPRDIDDGDPEIFRIWDALTEKNGVRELEVGEAVLLPLPAGELLTLAEGRRREALRASDLVERAVAAADSHAFGLADDLASEAMELGADESVVAAIDERRAARAARLAEEASALAAASGRFERLVEHGKLVAVLEEARGLLLDAEALVPGEQHAESLEAIALLLEEATRYRVRPDGAVVVSKPAGVAYTAAARDAVEWLIERRIATSGKAFPHSGAKTSDEIGWARLLRDAYGRARKEGVDFETLLSAEDDEAEFVIPNPARYFVVVADAGDAPASVVE